MMAEPEVICVQVVRANGDHEKLTMTGPLTLLISSGLDRIVTSTGMEHWFTKEGIYDGWGMEFAEPVPCDDPQDALDLATAIDNEREIIPPQEHP